MNWESSLNCLKKPWRYACAACQQFFFVFLLAFKDSMWNGCTTFSLSKKSINLSDCYYVLQCENSQDVIETTQKKYAKCKTS